MCFSSNYWRKTMSIYENEQVKVFWPTPYGSARARSICAKPTKNEMIQYNHNVVDISYYWISIATLASDVGLSVRIALSGNKLLYSLVIVIIQKSFKVFTVKQEKHDAVNLLVQTKLVSIADIISQAMQHKNISSIEFYKVWQKAEKYRKLKADIRNQTKTRAMRIAIKQQEGLL